MATQFITFSDGTNVVYSDVYERDGKNHVLVKFERRNDKQQTFDRMECELPNGEMVKVTGFTEDEVKYHHEKMIRLQDDILSWALEDKEKGA